ncbi:MAG: thermonuclease family protein [Pseudomonadota bacterium]
MILQSIATSRFRLTSLWLLKCVLLNALPAKNADAQSTAQITPIDRREIIEGPVTATVLRVRDGDSIDVLAHIWPGQRIAVSVRLRNIDAPELRARCQEERLIAKAAKHHLISLIMQAGTNPTITLYKIGGGKYFGRILASARSSNGIDIGQNMIKSGLAVPYRQRKRQNWCAVRPAILN